MIFISWKRGKKLSWQVLFLLNKSFQISFNFQLSFNRPVHDASGEEVIPESLAPYGKQLHIKVLFAL